MNELLEQLGRNLAELQQYVSSVAPDVWAIYLRQVLVDAWLCLGCGVFLLMLGSYLARLGFKNRKEEWCPGPFIGAGLSFAIGVGLGLAEGLRVLLNPQYFALQDLLKALIK